MELQALANSPNRAWKDRIRTDLPRIAEGLAGDYGDDFLLVCILFTAHPEARSLWIGSAVVAIACLILTWIDGYPEKRDGVYGPFRFVRFPRRLAIWLLWIGLCVGTRSFPGLLCTLILLPYFHWRDLRTQAAARTQLDLETIRYQQFVPALVPTLFPFGKNPGGKGGEPKFSWRRALFLFEGKRLRLVSIVSFAGLALLLSHLIGERYLAAAGFAWVAARILHAIAKRPAAFPAFMRSRLRSK